MVHILMPNLECSYWRHCLGCCAWENDRAIAAGSRSDAMINDQIDKAAFKYLPVIGPVFRFNRGGAMRIIHVSMCATPGFDNQPGARQKMDANVSEEQCLARCQVP